MRGLIFAVAIIATLTIGYLAQLYPVAIQRRIAETLRPTESADLVARIQAVKDLAGAIEQSGGLGIGVGQSEAYLRNQHSTAPVVTIHNVVLHAAVEGGVLAAASIMLIPVAIVVLWRAALRRVRSPEESFLLNWQVATLLAIYAGAQLTPSLYEHSFYAIIPALAATAVDVRETATDRSLVRVLQKFVRGHRTTATV
jgi:O-antigen ligase